MHDSSTNKSAVSLHHSLKHDGIVYILRGHPANAVSVSTFEFFQVGANPVAPQCFVDCCSLPRVRNKQLANKPFSYGFPGSFEKSADKSLHHVRHSRHTRARCTLWRFACTHHLSKGPI
ncbi:hypothetical protein PISMIDRAFT_393138 [Pisolithus microcarpus 441]|uniref:Uncharacterized protein n=1 Tax=Pisolithus microcarpus 441 TaxID=765257 RepID=A0A0C9ZLJ2_9AGAM|nr:hypothetical protein PISMIDRAFT_393138 [Pisolithus microcarpus 441]